MIYCKGHVCFDPSNIEYCRMHIVLHLIDNLQTPKTRLSFLDITFKVSQLFIPLSGRFRKQDLEKKQNETTVSFLPIMIEK